jgi:hypothetical protein
MVVREQTLVTLTVDEIRRNSRFPCWAWAWTTTGRAAIVVTLSLFSKHLAVTHAR